MIRLHLGSHSPQLTKAANRSVALTIAPGETEVYRGPYYKGRVLINVIGVWKLGLSEPLWIMTDLPPEADRQIYFQRMKIDESFRDLKNLLGLGKVMSKKLEHMEKMLALMMLAYSIGVLTGEGVRDAIFGKPIKVTAKIPITERIPDQPQLRQGKK